MAVHDKLTVVTAFTLTTLSTLIVALRFYSRHFLVGKLSSPDWVMLAALIGTWSSAVANYYQIKFMQFTPEDIKNVYRFAYIIEGALLSFWIYRLNYIINLCLVKTSILLFYDHFAATQRNFRYIVRGMMCLIVLSSLGMAIAGILSCVPPGDAWSFKVFWEGFMGIHADQCYDPTKLWLAGGGFNLATDCIIWILPIPFVLNLRTMKQKRKLELLGIFSVGIFAIIGSAVRLHVLVVWVSDWTKQNNHLGDLLIWGNVEQHAGILSASIPFLRPLVRKFFKAFHGKEREQPSPAPIARLFPQQMQENPQPMRTPIIPSPSPTFGSSASENRPAPSPLSPLALISPNTTIITAH
ncbi:hypothetical protein P154DRAFT_177796 [Amniculicola lignicola CBS 123094]|uniref:Rhodopsin domain-containing protein n=1 Tax=Amniculicola lignicola CBS 123094 TaxID=1392246 RepID=A0A6A5WYG9_9PLEO|nr:hypothetical protein P154DRAFT_177796 [Amniculicola lignicola CBS 123094]